MTGKSEQLAQLLKAEFPGFEFTVMLSEAGQALVGALDEAWVPSALRPVLALYERVEVVFSSRSEEPMQNPSEQNDPFENVYKSGLEVGIITAQARTDVPLKRIMLAVPTVGLLDKPSAFKLQLNRSKLTSVAAKVYTKLYHVAPLTLDVYRQHRNTHGRGRKHQVLPPMQRGGAKGKETNSSVMWIAMHWAETGGAESWAWEQARLAKEAGFSLIFTFDRAAPQRQLNLATSLSKHVYLIDHALPRSSWPALVMSLMETHRPGHIHIHHSHFAYSMIPLIKSCYPQIRIEDSTHILEHRGGGFVTASIGASAYVDLHHVISPQLQNLYELEGVDSSKVVYRPLTAFTSNQEAPAPIRTSFGPAIRVGFLGRLSAQKRPVLFLGLAAYLNATHPGRFKFVMQGDGELETIVEQQMRRLKLSSIVERRPWGNTADFFADIDVLVITSENEGLTLTTIEADAAGVLVISTNVGSQETVVARQALLPREPLAFIAGARKLFPRLLMDEQFVHSLASAQRKQLDDLRSIEPASRFFEQHYASLWQLIEVNQGGSQ